VSAPTFDSPTVGLKVVVVEDTPDILELIEVVLSEEGYQVVPCLDASGAVETIANEQPALAIVDLRIAGVQHWELVDALLADPRTATIPLIVCSGAAAELREAEARLRARGVGILVKPFDIDDLVRLVRTTIGTE